MTNFLPSFRFVLQYLLAFPGHAIGLLSPLIFYLVKFLSTLLKNLNVFDILMHICFLSDFSRSNVSSMDENTVSSL